MWLRLVNRERQIFFQIHSQPKLGKDLFVRAVGSPVAFEELGGAA
jgi:hypothetical protein